MESAGVVRVGRLWKEELNQLVEDKLLSWDTVRNYIYCLNKQIVPNIGSLQLCELTPGECDDLFSKIRQTSGIGRARYTRTVLGLCLSAIHSGPIKGAEGYGVFRM